MQSKWQEVDRLIGFVKNFSVRAQDVNDALESKGLSPLKQGVKLHDLILRPQLTIHELAGHVPQLHDAIMQVEELRRDEIVEAAEIKIKYQGYIEREELIAQKIARLDQVKIAGKFDYASLHALSTEARQKLERIKPETVGQASRIPGISPSDVNILLLLLGR